MILSANPPRPDEPSDLALQVSTERFVIARALARRLEELGNEADSPSAHPTDLAGLLDCVSRELGDEPSPGVGADLLRRGREIASWGERASRLPSLKASLSPEAVGTALALEGRDALQLAMKLESRAQHLLLGAHSTTCLEILEGGFDDFFGSPDRVIPLLGLPDLEVRRWAVRRLGALSASQE